MRHVWHLWSGREGQSCYVGHPAHVAMSGGMGAPAKMRKLSDKFEQSVSVPGIYVGMFSCDSELEVFELRENESCDDFDYLYEFPGWYEDRDPVGSLHHWCWLRARWHAMADKLVSMEQRGVLT